MRGDYSMKPKKLVTLIVITASLFGLSQTAWACKKEVVDLRNGLNNPASDGICAHLGELRIGKKGIENCDGLNDKLEAALNKLAQGDIRDTVWKIDDFGATLEMLTYSSEPRISVASYNRLIAPKYNDAALCVKRLKSVQTD
jgi:hypothetical protein